MLFIVFLIPSWRPACGAAVQIGKVVPGFYLRGLHGEDFFLSKYCGEKAKRKGEIRAIVISFFATWCKPCIKEIPQLEEIYKRYSDKGVKIWLIDVGENVEKVRTFVEDQKIGLPVLMDSYSRISKDKFGVESLPSLFVMDPDGRIAYVSRGYRPDLERELGKVLDRLTGVTVDWGAQVIRVTGVGEFDPDLPSGISEALRSARDDALRRILASLREVPVDSKASIGDLVSTSEDLASRLEETVVENIREVGEPRYPGTGTVEIDAEMALTGNVTDMFLPEVEEKSSTASSSGEYSGLVIDVRGLGFHPAIAPRVLDEDGREVYGVDFADRERAIRFGIAGYSTDLEEAMQAERVGDKPLAVRGVRVSGGNGTDVVISTGDARFVSRLRALRECQVVIVY